MKTQTRLRRLLTISLFSLVGGCSTLSENLPDQTTSAEIAIGCRVLDAATTLHIISEGGYELNPIMKKVLSFGNPQFFLVEAAVSAYWWYIKDDVSKETMAVVAAASCSMLPNNLIQLTK